VLNTYDVVVPAYGTAGDAIQKGTSFHLNTGDARALDGFYLKGNVHFVHNVDVGAGYCGFNYYRINVNTLAANAYSFTHAGISDYAYPAVASAAKDSNDNSVVIAYNECSSTLFPQTCVVACDQTGTFSAPVVVRKGDTFVHYSFTNPGQSERWGDYTGLAKRFGDPANALWMASMYGGTGRIWQQWIAKIVPKTVGVESMAAQATEAKVFPNPVVDRYNLVFNLPERQRIIVNITDMQGRTVVELYDGIAENGENAFSFNKGNLANGIYSLNIIGERTNLRNEKIVVNDK